MNGNVKETVIQFGEGGFLRGFVDYFFHKLQEKGLYDGKIVVVQPIEKGMCSVLEQQGCEYNLFLRGIDNGQVVDEHTHIDIISRCVNPYENFESYMKLAENPDLLCQIPRKRESSTWIPTNLRMRRPGPSRAN